MIKTMTFSAPVRCLLGQPSYNTSSKLPVFWLFFAFIIVNFTNFCTGPLVAQTSLEALGQPEVDVLASGNELPIEGFGPFKFAAPLDNAVETIAAHYSVATASIVLERTADQQLTSLVARAVDVRGFSNKADVLFVFDKDLGFLQADLILTKEQAGGAAALIANAESISSYLLAYPWPNGTLRARMQGSDVVVFSGIDRQFRAVELRLVNVQPTGQGGVFEPAALQLRFTRVSRPFGSDQAILGGEAPLSARQAIRQIAFSSEDVVVGFRGLKLGSSKSVVLDELSSDPLTARRPISEQHDVLTERTNWLVEIPALSLNNQDAIAVLQFGKTTAALEHIVLIWSAGGGEPEEASQELLAFGRDLGLDLLALERSIQVIRDATLIDSSTIEIARAQDVRGNRIRLLATNVAETERVIEQGPNSYSPTMLSLTISSAASRLDP